MRRASRPASLSLLLLASVAATLLAASAAGVPQERRTFTGTAQVTAVDLIVDVRDAAGGVPADLTPADFEVLEDGEQRQVIGVEIFSRGEATTAAREDARRASAGPKAPAAPTRAVNQPWRMVIYVDQVLSSSRTIRRACQGLAAQAGRLTELGPVEIVLATDQAKRVLPPTQSAHLLEQTLERLARETAGRDELRRLRRRFLEDLRFKGELDGTGRPILAADPFAEGTGPGTGGGGPLGLVPPEEDAERDVISDGTQLSRTMMVRTAVAEEQMLLARQHDVLMAFVAGYLDPFPRALLLVNDGYDLDPRDFYLSGDVPGSKFFSDLNRVIQDRGAGSASEELARTLAASGWVTLAMGFGGISAESSIDAEISGRGRIAGLLYAKEDSAESLPSALVSQPLAPLNQMAAYTGGETLTGVGKLPAALTRLGERVRLTYQVDRLPDGKLHRVEVRARREGLEVNAPKWSGAPAPEAVSSARARRLLAGDVDRGELAVTAAIAFAEPVADGEPRQGTFQARLDLSPIAATLAGLPSTALRLTLAVSFPEGVPFVHHERIAGQALAGKQGWTFSMPVTLPAAVEKAAVVIEEETSGAWGGSLAGLVIGALPDSVLAPAADSVVAASGGRGAPAADVGGVPTAGADLPADLLPKRKAIVLLPPADEVVTGRVRVESLIADPRVARVDFLLDGSEVASRAKPPFEARLDFGNLPAPRTLEAVAFDAEGRELGRDAVTVNAGLGAFRVRIIEPRSGERVGPVDVEAEVQLPSDATLDRVEVFWNGNRVATLFQAPFRARVLIPSAAPMGYLTVQARRSDGATVEDVVFMNATGAGERVEVRLVELPTVVTDVESRPVRDLPKNDFRVFDEGLPQTITDFRGALEAPLNLGMLIDTSGSMSPVLGEVKTAAIDFLLLTLGERDRAFIVDFASRPRLTLPLTGDRQALVSAVAALRAGGYSALCDALVYSLVQMQQVKGRRALVLLTDGVGRDERVSFETCLRMVEHSGVPIYAILLAGDDPTAKEGGVSSETLSRLVAPVGGKLFHAAEVGNLGRAYRSILEELRSQYLLAYYPEAGPADAGWRRVDVEVDRPGLEARTIAGYYP